MAKKKTNTVKASNGVSEVAAPNGTQTTPPSQDSISTSQNKTLKDLGPGSPVLTISRNKHWRYISAFHGPWLQLPQEILESVAHGDYFAPPPRRTYPGVLHDLVKIRKLVDEASELAVRAQNGTAASTFSEPDNGMFGGGTLGIGFRGGPHAKLSPERRHRMRELATHKLSQAYKLDEVAASVATMQGASSLETVASLVLQRNPSNIDAKYVHFFHEKIPTRMMTESTPLTVLDEIIASEPSRAATFRTRALTRIFNEDHLGAIRDLTEALTLCRLGRSKHVVAKDRLLSTKTTNHDTQTRKAWARDWTQDNKISDEDRPAGLEMQLLFQRGNQHLTLACQHIRTVLGSFKLANKLKEHAISTAPISTTSYDCEIPKVNKCTSAESQISETKAFHRALEARDLLRKFAKRALRDYTAFFSQLDYAFSQTHASFGISQSVSGIYNYNVRESPETDTLGVSTMPYGTALVARSSSSHKSEHNRNRLSPWPSTSIPIIHDIASVLSTSPPADLPLFPPPTMNALQTCSLKSPPHSPLQSCPHEVEMITYHPFLIDTLHSFLLAHCLLQTPSTSLLRLANNVARIVRLADGYPFFLPCRSPARSEWTNILRKLDNWVGLAASWDMLCHPASVIDEGVRIDSNPQSHISSRPPILNKDRSQSPNCPKPPPSSSRSSSFDSDKDKSMSASASTKASTLQISASSASPCSSANPNVESHDKPKSRKTIHKNTTHDPPFAETEAVDSPSHHATHDTNESGHRYIKISEDYKTSTRVPTDFITTDNDKNTNKHSLADSDAPIGAGSIPPGSVLDKTHLQAAETTNHKSNTKSSTTTTNKANSSNISPKTPINKITNAVARDEEYLIGTKRALLIAQWIKEAPSPGDIPATVRGTRNKARRKTKGRFKTESQIPMTANTIDGGDDDGNDDGNDDINDENNDNNRISTGKS